MFLLSGIIRELDALNEWIDRMLRLTPFKHTHKIFTISIFALIFLKCMAIFCDLLTFILKHQHWFIQQILLESLRHARHCARYRHSSTEWKRRSPCPYQTYTLYSSCTSVNVKIRAIWTVTAMVNWMAKQLDWKLSAFSKTVCLSTDQPDCCDLVLVIGLGNLCIS